MIAVDAVPDEVGATWIPVDDVDESTIAYLQYTSGSTPDPDRRPDHPAESGHQRGAGDRRAGGRRGDRGVSWLPFFHDMGLITAMVSPMIGHYFTFMTPLPPSSADPIAGSGRWP